MCAEEALGERPFLRKLAGVFEEAYRVFENREEGVIKIAVGLHSFTCG